MQKLGREAGQNHYPLYNLSKNLHSISISNVQIEGRGGST